MTFGLDFSMPEGKKGGLNIRGFKNSSTFILFIRLSLIKRLKPDGNYEDLGKDLLIEFIREIYVLSWEDIILESSFG